MERVSIYPVKSLGARNLDRVDLLPSGPAGDRAFTVVDADGRTLRGKDAPELSGVRPTGDVDADAATVTALLGRSVRLLPAAGDSAADVAAVHLVSRGAMERAAAGDVPEGCSADDPRANLRLEVDGDERGWVGRTVVVGTAVLRVTRTPKHCLGVYAEVRRPGTVRAGDPVRLLPGG